MTDGRGFTLLELLLSLALVGIVMAMTLPFLHLQDRLWTRQEESREGYRTLTFALEWLTRDLQQAGYHGPNPPLSRLEETRISYELSRDAEDPASFSPTNARLITVYLDGRDLKYRIQRPLPAPASGWRRGSTAILASGVSFLRFRGLDGEGSPALSPEQAVLVEISVSGAGGAALRTLVSIRNARPGGGS